MTVLMRDVAPDLDAAFTTIYLQECKRVQQLAAQRVQNPALAEDVAQEAFLRLWRYMDSGHMVANPAALLTTLTQRAAADHYRLARNTREGATDFSDPVASLRMPAARSAEDVAVARQAVRDAYAGVAA